MRNTSPNYHPRNGRLFVINEFDDESDRNTRRVDVGHLLSFVRNNDSPRARVNPVSFSFLFFPIFLSILRDEIVTEKERKERKKARKRERESERERVEIDARSRKGKDVAVPLAACDSIGKRLYRSTGGITKYISFDLCFDRYSYSRRGRERKREEIYRVVTRIVTFDSVSRG